MVTAKGTKPLNLASLVTLVILIGCNGGETTSGSGGGCETGYNVTGTWEGILTSRRDGTSRPFSAILVQGGYFVTGAIVAPPCWPFHDDLTGITCGSRDQLSVTSGLIDDDFDPVTLDVSLFTLEWQPNNDPTAMGIYEMFSKVLGCPRHDIGSFTMTKVD